MRFIALGKTDVGKLRKENQDHFLIMNEEKVFVVADGMGGHAGGSLASTIVIDTLQKELCGKVVTRELINEALKIVNSNILSQAQDNDMEGMGTTLVLALFDEKMDEWLIAHVGDSRAYSFDEAGAITQITADHSYVNELVKRGTITAEEAKKHPQKNILTRALGIEDGYRAEWDIISNSEIKGLLLCSDGLYNMVENTRLEEIFASVKPVEDKVNEMVNEANVQGGLDNITAVLIVKEA